MNRAAVRSARRSGPRGLTLVELLAVIAIIGLLAGLLLPAMQGAREAARRVQCGNNLKQLALALSAHSSQMGHFPAAAEHRLNQCTSTSGTEGGLPLSFTDGRPAWSIRLLPFLEQQPLYDRFDFAQPFFGIICFNNTGCNIDNATTPAQRVNLPLQQTPVPGFMCPSHPVAGTPMRMWLESSGTVADCGGLRPMYHGIAGGGPDSEAHCYSSPWAGSKLPPDRRNFFNNGIFAVNSRTTPAAIRDGLSNTLLLGEGEMASDFLWSSGARGCDKCAEQGNTLAIQDPINTAYSEAATDIRSASRRCLRSKHPGAALGAMADGSVHVFGDDMSVTVLQLLGKRADRQAVSWP